MNPVYLQELKLLSCNSRVRQGPYLANLSHLITFKEAADILRILGK